jgi:hypothetical protein
MNIQKYIIPVFVSTNLLGQTVTDEVPEVSFGFVHSAYTSMCFQPTTNTTSLNKEIAAPMQHSTISETQFGFGVGFFMYLPLNDIIVFKPKMEGLFSNTAINQIPTVHATSLDLSISPGFCIALKPADDHGVIYLARNMSCYLTSKQPYLSIAPVINLKKFDEGFLQKGFQNEIAFGVSVGYGISYEFHGINFAPEISYNISTTAQNKMNESNKIMHSITLAINIY